MSSPNYSLAVILRICVINLLLGGYSAQLSFQFYKRSCPEALDVIKFTVRSAVANEPRMGASLLRLHFHDCFVQGCDGSVILDDNSDFIGEKTAFANANSLRGFDVIDAIKSNLENICPGVVSCADILALAARDSVDVLGGPSWKVPLGRRDSTTANRTGASTDLPGPSSSLASLISSFAKKGLSTADMIALSGAHTIGLARCRFFRRRIYNDTDIDPWFAADLQSNCPSTSGDGNDNLSPLDFATPTTFDNQYYKNLVQFRGLFHSDQQLFGNMPTDSTVFEYQSHKSSFFHDFADAMVRMGNISPLTGFDGQIRTNCRVVN